MRTYPDKGNGCQSLTIVGINKLQKILPTKMFVNGQKLSAFDTIGYNTLSGPAHFQGFALMA